MRLLLLVKEASLCSERAELNPLELDGLLDKVVVAPVVGTLFTTRK